MNDTEEVQRDEPQKIIIPKVQVIDPKVLANVRAATTHWRQQFVEFDKAMKGIRQKLQTDAEPIKRALQALQKFQANWGDYFHEITKNNAAKQALREAGLLPHKTTPWHAFENEDLDAVPRISLAHYAENWAKIEEQIIADLAAYQISASAKESFYEALACHRNGLYRPAVLTLLPAVEMEFRKAFELNAGDPAASLKELREVIKNVPAGYVLSHVAPFDMFRVLDEHLYESVKSQEALEKFQVDPIPNRHAAIHGLIEYTDVLHSLNAIIIADYVFLMISQITKYAENQEAQ